MQGTPMTGAQRLGWWTRIVLVTAILLLTCWVGIREGMNGYHGSASLTQRITAGTQICYGIASAAALIALFLRARWLRWALVGWGVMVSLTSALAPVVWGGSPWLVGVISGLACAATAALIGWGALAHVRSVS